MVRGDYAPVPKLPFYVKYDPDKVKANYCLVQTRTLKRSDLTLFYPRQSGWSMNQVGPRGETIHILSGQGFFTLICHDLNLIWFNVTANPLPKVTLGVVRASLGQGERPVILNGLLQFTCKRGYNYYKMKKMFKFSFLSLHIFETLIPN